MTTQATTQTPLTRATHSTFEMLGFLLPLPPSEGEEMLEHPFKAGARVRFRGQVSGVLEVDVFGEILQEMTTNMLALDRPASRSEELSALGEVANVICGNVLPDVFGARSVFDLSAPEVDESSAVREDVDPDELVETTAVNFDGGRAVVLLRTYA